jgi:hypothetical protein
VDVLTLRVAARFIQARPIPLDHGAIKRDSDRIAHYITKYTAHFPSEQVVGRHAKIFDNQETSVWVIGGDFITIPVLFESTLSKSTSFTVGGMYSVVKREIWVHINGSKTFGDFADPENQPLVSADIFKVLIHELTHAAEGRFLPHEIVDPKESPEERNAYFNQAHEVRAYMQQIVSQCLDIANRYLLRKQYKGRPHQFVEAVVDLSETWKKVRDYMNPQSKAKILKAVYMALDEAGLLL